MDFLLKIDRRLIFVLVLLVVIAGTLFPERLQFPIGPSKPVKGVYDAVEKFDAGAPVLVSMDFDPPSAPELEPMVRACLRQCFRKKLHVIGMTHWNTGLALVERIMAESAMEFDDVEVETAAVASEKQGEAARAAISAAKTPAEIGAVLRLVGFGDSAETTALLEPFAPRTALENLVVLVKSWFGGGAKANAGQGEKNAAAIQAIVDAAKRVPAEKALPRRSVNFARDPGAKHLVFDKKWKARDLVWHLKEGDIAEKPVPVVDEGQKILRYELVRVAKRTSTLKYGEDWCFLGYKAGFGALILTMGQNLYAAFPTDNYDASTRKLPITEKVSSLVDLKYLVCFAAGDTAEQWIVYGARRYGFPMGIGCTAVMAPDLYVYYGAHQITGIAGGIKGAWEYEALSGVPAQATSRAPVQSVAHLLVMALILFCNVVYFAQRSSSRASR